MDRGRADSLEAELDELLAHPGAMDAERFQGFLAAQGELGLVHGVRPLCRHLRPYVLDALAYYELLEAAELVAGALERVAQRALTSDDLARLLDLSAEERELASHDPGYPQLLVVGRLDMLVTEAGFRFIELNADSPAGITDQLLVNRSLFELPHLSPTRERQELWTPFAHEALIRALGRTYAAWGGSATTPAVAIVDWASADTSGEFRTLILELERAGYRVDLVSPDGLRYDGERLYARGTPIDIVYRRVIIQELLEQGGMHHPLIRAYRDGRVCVANSFRTKALNKKAAFAALSDPIYADLFSAEQRAAIRRYVPWTRVLGRGQTDFHGERVALREFAVRHQGELVLKPNDDYGGKGVVLGWTVTPEVWRAALDGAGHAVLQERQRSLKHRVPTFRDGGVVYEDVYFDICPFVFAGRAEGAMVRFSGSEVSNVSAGGSVSGLLVVGDQETTQARFHHV